MKVKLFSDEDFYIGKFAPDMFASLSGYFVNHRCLGYDAVDVLDMGLIGNSDDTLLKCAINDKRAFLSKFKKFLLTFVIPSLHSGQA